MLKPIMCSPLLLRASKPPPILATAWRFQVRRAFPSHTGNFPSISGPGDKRKMSHVGTWVAPAQKAVWFKYKTPHDSCKGAHHLHPSHDAAIGYSAGVNCTSVDCLCRFDPALHSKQTREKRDTSASRTDSDPFTRKCPHHQPRGTLENIYRLAC